MTKSEIDQVALLSDADLRASAVELCEAGLLTCTSGNPGDEDASYAVAWLPLDEPDKYSAAVRRRHQENMRNLGFE